VVDARRWLLSLQSAAPANLWHRLIGLFYGALSRQVPVVVEANPDGNAKMNARKCLFRNWLSSVRKVKVVDRFAIAQQIAEQCTTNPNAI
jgi:hypothetical protein